ncbi:hypothetical protein E2320_007458 [Naja naja]|nr:hypothetical protein E2320_007458 [Naja naja]
MEGGGAVRRRTHERRRRRRPRPGSRADSAGINCRGRSRSTSPPARKKLNSDEGEEELEEPKPEYFDSDDMFANYDSFSANDSFLTERDGLEQKHVHFSKDALDSDSLDCNLAVRPVGGGTLMTNAGKLARVFSETNTAISSRDIREYDSWKRMKEQDDSSEPQDTDLESLPSSQLLFRQHSDECSQKETVMKEIPCQLDFSHLPYRSDTENNKQDCKSVGAALFDPGRRKSLKDHLKSAMAENARSSASLVSKSKQLKEAIVTEEMAVAETTHSLAFVDIGPFYGLPTKVKELLLQIRGIEKLYDWQHDCLTFESLQKRKNLIYSLPTSGGKTLVAEILILRELLCKQMDVLMILPYVALVQEKLHMLGEGGRGGMLEMTLSKILYASKTTQIIGMSATLRNVEDLQQFLKAEFYTSDFRPDSIYETDSKAENGLTFSRLLDFKERKKMDMSEVIRVRVHGFHRVILRAPYVATDFLKKNQYKQMIGRAGRAGIDKAGESILIVQEKDKELIANNPEDIYQFMRATLLSIQPQLLPSKSLRDVTMEALQWLKHSGLLKEKENSDGEKNCQNNLGITPLGRATFKGSVELAHCDTLYADLKKGLEGLILESYLHLIYLITPYDMIPQCSPNWMVYFKQFNQLSPIEQQVTSTVGVPESFIIKKASGQAIKNELDSNTVNRLYLSLILNTLLRETNIWDVSEKFNIPRGFVQSLLNSAASFSSSVLHFCEELDEFWVYKALLPELTKRLSYCVKAELIPLMEVVGVLEARAKQLYNLGYTTLAHLANADPELLVKSVVHMSRTQARKIVSSAKMLLAEKTEALQEEVEELLRIPTDVP